MTTVAGDPMGEAAVARGRAPGWRSTAISFIWVLFCLEIGLFLLVFPWLDHWERNYFSGFGERWYRVWTNSYFRGAVSGLGMVNLYISFWDLMNLLRSLRR
jgi:hypothetical protein